MDHWRLDPKWIWVKRLVKEPGSFLIDISNERHLHDDDDDNDDDVYSELLLLSFNKNFIFVPSSHEQINVQKGRLLSESSF